MYTAYNFFSLSRHGKDIHNTTPKKKSTQGSLLLKEHSQSFVLYIYIDTQSDTTHTLITITTLIQLLLINKNKSGQQERDTLLITPSTLFIFHF